MVSMEKINYLTLIPALILLFAGCENDEQHLKPSIDYSPTTQRILDFKTSMTKKSTGGDNMHPDSLVWYTEAVLNMSYGYPHLNYSQKSTDSLQVTVNLTDNENVAYEDVTDAFIRMNNFVANQYNDYYGEPKRMVAIDVRLKSCNTTEANLWIYSTIGTAAENGENGNEKSTNPFAYHEYWHAYYYDGGECNGYDNPEYAAGKLTLFMKYYTPNLGYLANNRYYYTDIEIDIKTNSYHYPNNDPATMEQYPYLLYERESWGTDCLIPSDMEFMLYNMDDILIDDLASQPQYEGKLPFNVEIHSLISVGKNYELAHYQVKTDMGIQHYREINPADPVPIN